MLKSDVTEPAEGPTTWINPIVQVPKNTGSTRLCVDMRKANKAIERERHIIPTLDDIIAKLNCASVPSKLDMNSGYNQLVLDPESRDISTFSTHKGLFRYKRLFFGINAAAEVFNESVKSTVADIPNQINISDDLFVFGSSIEEHDKALHAVLNRFKEKGLTVNANKCEFYKSSITFYGMVFSSEGFTDPEKVEAIQNIIPPENSSECRSLLGMTNYVSRFIRNYSTLTAPIKELTKADCEFHLGEKQKQALSNIQHELASHSVMAYFDPNSDTELCVDASPLGVAAVLMQKGKVIAYASKALTDVEQRYSQIEREMYTISWSCHRFRLYLLGKSFKVFTDHKPLLGICNNPRSKASLRIENWLLRLQGFDFEVLYKPGKENLADYMSRHALPGGTNIVTDSAQQHVNAILNQSKPQALSLDEIAEATASDDTLQCVLKFIENDRWNLDTLPFPDTDVNALKIIKLIKHEFASADGKWLLRDSRIVMPNALQERVIELAHEWHQGKVKIKRLLRSKVWFPYMDSKCEKLVDQSLLCQAATPQNVREPLQMSKLPEEAWKNVSIDFCEIGNEYALVIIDEYSRYPVVEIVSSTSSNSVIPKLDSVFSMLGVPKVVKTDNGPPFNGDKFRQFAEYMGFKHRKISPFWPEAHWKHTSKHWTCFHFLEITEQLPIAPLATRLQLHFWVEKNNSMITAKSTKQLQETPLILKRRM